MEPYFNNYYPWIISNYIDKYHPRYSPTLNIALLKARFMKTFDFKYSPNYGKTLDILRVTTSGGNLSHGYCNHNITLPPNYKDEKINYIVNKYDHVFFIEPLQGTEEEIIQHIEQFIVHIPDEWLVLEYQNNKKEFEAMLTKLNPVIIKKTLERIEIYIGIKRRVAAISIKL